MTGELTVLRIRLRISKKWFQYVTKKNNLNHVIAYYIHMCMGLDDPARVNTEALLAQLKTASTMTAEESYGRIYN